MMAKRPVTVTYILFYLLFSTDFWRILMGATFSGLLTPLIPAGDIRLPGRLVIYVMTAGIGFAASRVPATWITGKFKKWILGKKERK